VTEKILVIVNSFAGKLSGPAKCASIQQGMRAAGLPIDTVLSNRPGHGIELTRRAVTQGYTTIIAAGGDGTINEVVNGLMLAPVGPAACRLGLLPLGTGNDLAHTLGLPTDIEAACRRIAAGQTRSIDVGLVNGRYFINNAAVGLEPLVPLSQQRMRWLKGPGRYVVAALKTIAQAQSWDMRLEWDTGGYAGPLLLVSVGNGRRTGGAFYLTPQARPDDGQFDFVYGARMSRLKMLALLPRLFNGSHLGHPLVGYHRTRQLAITASPATPIQADGEVFETAATRITYQILPGAVRVLE
jgi:diacylglycerol kinase (ATP)